MASGARRRAAAILVALTLTALASWPGSATAAPARPDPAAAAAAGQARPDFRFAAPSVTFGVRVGYVDNRAEAEIFDFVTEQLTLERSDFDGPAFALDLGFKLSERIDAVFGFEYSGRTKRSEFRDFVDQDGIPIVQDTRLTQVPLTASLKVYLTSRGRRVSSYAWVPASVLPYVGGGVGATYYRFEQEGEFIDFVDFSIFEAVFESDGWAFSTHAFAGVDFKLSNQLGFVVEGRYQWAEADLVGSFVGFDPIDLTGARITAGVNWKF